MFLLRKLGKLIFGIATPLQWILACVLGMALGFVPGLSIAPGLVLVLIGLTFLLNVNLFLVALTTLLGRILGLVLMPVSFTIGAWLLDGPLQPFFKTLINAPFLALCGFDYYVVTGGLLLGLILGAGLGVILALSLGRFHRALFSRLDSSESLQAFMSKNSAKILAWLLLGGKPDLAKYKLLQEKGLRSPFRLVGLIAAGLVIVIAVVAALLLNGPLVRYALKSGLERVNGATVDVGEARIDLAQGKLVIAGLAMADPDRLDRNLFAAGHLEADLSNLDLFRKRLHLENLIVTDVKTGTPRETPGVRLVPAPEPPPPPEEGAKTLEDYVQDYELWRDRLAQVKRWLDKLSGPPAEEEPKTMKERLEEQMRSQGYAQVRALHLIEGAPSFQVSHVEINGLVIEALGDKTLDLVADHLSTQPRLVDLPPSIRLAARDESLLLALALGGSARVQSGNSFALMVNDLPADAVRKMLKEGKVASVLTMDAQNPTLDLLIASDDAWGADGRLNLPVSAKFNAGQSTGQVGGNMPASISAGSVSITGIDFMVIGTFAQPRIDFDAEQVKKMLIGAAKARAMQELTSRLDASGLTEKLGAFGDVGQGLQGAILSGDTAQVTDAAKAEAEKAAEKAKEEAAKRAKEEAEKALGEEGGKLLEGIFKK